ncbi:MULTISPECIES: YraN family protein [Allobranchiibius]|uniref:UPF0102 protein HNR15_001090 n=1 Tax=Allobranchiibius huperziae TaxID=1874116 RepID=A0A853DC00_9MICO|nr:MULTISPECIES: YraN family protein [Allobranchiibius]MBO1768537.1 YraN family protein [Allobranchiibius sp. GilTou38]NYJ74127.1 putative endonuclease [Allobranchiibius huperziae]UIJ34466.1 YraN family protein [Allobranchiibius sp. GilTou73]
MKSSGPAHRVDPRHALGRAGEDYAVDYLRSQGMVVVERNWRCREGELDVIAFDEAHDTLVIVEVKTRRTTTFGSPVEAVTRLKAARLRHLAHAWLREHPVGVAAVRIDVVGILVRPHSAPVVEHVRDVW